MIKIAPSILSSDFTNVERDIVMLEESGADLLHCDVMDGLFVPNISFGPKMIADIRKKTKLPLDVHLMIVKPERYIDVFADSGADFITIHVESSDETASTLQKIKARGVKCGVVISPDTDVKVVEPFLSACDMVLLMSVYPGFGGQKFIDKSLERLAQLSSMKSKLKLDFDIEIDGGITEANVDSVLKAGANVIVAGNTIFGSANPSKTVKRLRG